MQPLQRATGDAGEPTEALVERSDVAAVEALAVVAEAAVAYELARAAREKFGGDALGDFVGAWRAYLDRMPWRRTHYERHVGPGRFHGRGEVDARAAGRRTMGRRAIDVDDELSVDIPDAVRAGWGACRRRRGRRTV